jgi:enoyl-CoA hydratase
MDLLTQYAEHLHERGLRSPREEATMSGDEFETVLYDVDDRVATVTMNRPDVHDALNFDLRRDLVAALKRAEAYPDVTVVLRKRAGKSFCAGYELKIPSFFEAQKQHTGWVGDPTLEGWTDQFARGCVRDWLNLWIF